MTTKTLAPLVGGGNEVSASSETSREGSLTVHTRAVHLLAVAEHYGLPVTEEDGELVLRRRLESREITGLETTRPGLVAIWLRRRADRIEGDNQ